MMIWTAFVLSCVLVVRGQGAAKTKKSDKLVQWCVLSQGEMEKCEKLAQVIKTIRHDSQQATYPGAKDFPVFVCVRGIDVFDCMTKIESGKADLITLDSGLGYYAGRYHNLLPLMAEHYTTDITMPTTFEAVAVVRRNTQISLSNLKNAASCHPGIGDSAGWVYPIGRLMTERLIDVHSCNSPVSAVSKYFSKGMCLPGSINSFFNLFGNNPVQACDLCKGVGDDWCSSGDPYAGYDGAFKCLRDKKGDIAFIRHDTIRMMQERGRDGNFSTDDYQLLCPNGRRESLSSSTNCNWGSPQSSIVMTSGMRDQKTVDIFKNFLQKLSEWFGETSSFRGGDFRLFSSVLAIKGKKQEPEKLNLMFNDATKMLVDVGGRDSYYTWVDQEFHKHIESLNVCPELIVRWCVVSIEEKAKCEDMMMTFRAKGLKPGLDCVLGTDTSMCMKMIRYNDADLMTLDAADVYYGGRLYGLVPIVKEDYGDMTGKYHVVAITHKTNKHLTIFNLKGKRSCHGGVRSGDGFIVPSHMLIETTQIRPGKCALYQSIGELFARSCIPGVLDQEYNSKQMPINLCESCASGSYRKCQRNSNELYYKSTGAFRCLVENGGDVAFARHLTVQDNTDGKNRAIWARNRRSDDYELMCKDGSRRAVSEWKSCNLGSVPGNAIVTAEHKSANQKSIYWDVLNYAQMFFSSKRDSDGDFLLFDSGIVHNDLIFSDDSVRLLRIDTKDQNYESYLGPEFKYSVEKLLEHTCDLDEDDIEKYKYSDGDKVRQFSLVTSLIILVITIFVIG